MERMVGRGRERERERMVERMVRSGKGRERERERMVGRGICRRGTCKRKGPGKWEHCWGRQGRKGTGREGDTQRRAGAEWHVDTGLFCGQCIWLGVLTGSLAPGIGVFVSASVFTFCNADAPIC